MSTQDAFTEEQKQYLQGFWSGAGAARVALGMTPLVRHQNGDARPATLAEAERLPSGPERIHQEAQNRFLGAGKKLAAKEVAKREKPPFGMWDEIVENAKAGRFPKGTDVFLYKFYGLFYVAPAQDCFMSRLKIPNGILKHWQVAGLADLADTYGGGYAHVTTRNNIQIREIGAADAVRYLEGLFELGITSKGSGADNIRNITGSPLAGLDAQELVDTRPLAREIQHFILQKPEFFGLPRKFNIAFDGGGRVAVLEETNDIGFQACRIGEGQAVPPGVYFRLALGGITGHQDIARDVGVMLRAEECTPVAAAIIRVFIDHGDRTNRHKTRMKYVIDQWGLEKYLDETEKVLGYRLPRVPLDALEPRGPIDRMGHVGVHAQVQPGKVYMGVWLPVGRMSTAQMRALAEIARRFGDGDVRLTVWQNLILSGISEDDVPTVEALLAEGGLGCRPTHLAAGLVACTGAWGCRFGLAHTKETAAAILEQLDGETTLDQPVNIHITGCTNSCAQHYIGDIGLLGAKVPPPGADDDDGVEEVEGFRLFVGGGYGPNARIGRDLMAAIPAENVPAVVRRILDAWRQHRAGDETFGDFTARHKVAALRQLFGL